MLVIDKNSPKPIYLQIADQIKSLIAKGSLRKGDVLPSVRQIAGDLGVNLNTAAIAFRSLQAEGLLQIRHGSGTLICADHIEVDKRHEAQSQLRSAITDLCLSGMHAEEIIAVVRRELDLLTNDRGEK
jgi:GntR family transcriptional regulator